MIDPTLLELLKPLGPAAIVVILLWWQLREATIERRATTAEFLKTLKETINNASSSSMQVAASLQDQTDAIRDTAALHTKEHERILHLLDAMLTASRPERRVLDSMHKEG